MHITNLGLFSLTLLATAFNMQNAAAKPSAMARRDSPGFRVLPDELEYEFRKRQATSVNPAPAPPASTPQASPPSQPTPPVVEPPTPPSTTSTSDAIPPSTSTSVPDSSSTGPGTSPGGSTIADSTTSTPGSSAAPPSNTGGSTSSGGSGGTESNTESGTETLAFPLPSDSESGSASGSGSASQSVPTTMSTVSYSLSYAYTTVTVSGEESISISSVSISQGYVPAAGPAPIAAPLVVQQAPPDPPPNPVCSIDYLPNDVWVTSGSDTSPPIRGNGNGTQTHVPPVSQCNNGTRVSNRVGSAIHLKFYGTEVQLLMVPGMEGGDYDIKIDDEEPVTLSNYKPGVSDCQVTSAWNRTGLDNKPHDVTVIVKGSQAGATGGSTVEFNGLIFKGPQTSSSSGPNIGLIVGATVGGVVLFAALVALTVVIVKKRRARQANEVHSDNGPASLASPSFRPQTVLSAHSGHTRADSSFSASGYNPSHQSWQNTAGIGAGAAAGAGMGTYGPVLGHTRQTSDAPLMGMVQGQHSPWQPGSPVMNNNAHIPPGAASPMMGSPHSRPMNMNNGYNNGQDRYSFAPSHHRTTSYGSDGRNPFEG